MKKERLFWKGKKKEKRKKKEVYKIPCSSIYYLTILTIDHLWTVCSCIQLFMKKNKYYSRYFNIFYYPEITEIPTEMVPETLLQSPWGKAWLIQLCRFDTAGLDVWMLLSSAAAVGESQRWPQCCIPWMSALDTSSSPQPVHDLSCPCCISVKLSSNTAKTPAQTKCSFPSCELTFLWYSISAIW